MKVLVFDGKSDVYDNRPRAYRSDSDVDRSSALIGMALCAISGGLVGLVVGLIVGLWF